MNLPTEAAEDGKNISFKALHSSKTFSSVADLAQFPKDKWATDYLYQEKVFPI